VTEQSLRKRVQVAVSAIGARLFRNNTGTAWAGDRVLRVGTNVTLYNARPFHGGLVKGGSDLIGWTPVRITAEDVGRDVAVFTAIELKIGRLKTTPDQDRFLQAVAAAGGIAAVARSPEEAVRAVEAGGGGRTSARYPP